MTFTFATWNLRNGGIDDGDDSRFLRQMPSSPGTSSRTASPRPGKASGRTGAENRESSARARAARLRHRRS